jgi:hypothetical protein
MSTTTRLYYIDESMGKDFHKVFERAQLWALRALERLGDPYDKEFHEIFRIIFKTPISDTQLMPRCPGFQRWLPKGWYEVDELQAVPVIAHVRRELVSFACGWARTSDRRLAEVRIHWDFPLRYKEIPEERGLFCDPVNDVFLCTSKEHIRQLWTQSRGFRAGSRPQGVDPTAIQHSRRDVIEFAQMLLDDQVTWENCVGEQLAGIHIDCLAHRLLETTLIHEMMHCEAYGLQDFYTDCGATGGWFVVMGATKEESYICAESMAMLCLAAALADLEPVGWPSHHRYAVSREGVVIVYQKNIFRELAPWAYPI